MKVIMLGSGTSTGVPRIGGEDGTGDWGDCDPEVVSNIMNEHFADCDMVMSNDAGRSMAFTGQ